MNIYKNYSLKNHNTFKMDVSCDRFVEIEAETDIPAMVMKGLFREPFYILGGGSNTLFTQHYRGTIIHPIFKGIQVMEETDDHVLLAVSAGEEWSSLIDYCIEHQYYGLENLAGIPGNVGSSPVQNIGAYGVEVKDCIERVDAYYTLYGNAFSLTNEQCQFGYRNSIFKNEYKNHCLISRVWFRLSKKEHYNLSYKALADAIGNETPTLKNLVNTIINIRNSKLPDIRVIGCAGSFFKNPVVSKEKHQQLLAQHPDLVSYPVDEESVKLAAGQLIEKAGWKGKRIGDAGVYDKQALVVVNYGNASPKEITQTYENVISDVKNIFDIELSPEVNIL